MIEDTSRSSLGLSASGRDIGHLVIISDNAWPSWALAIPLFLQSSTTIYKISIIVPTLAQVNTFGLSRESKVQWKKLDLTKPLIGSTRQWLTNILDSSDFTLYDGSMAGLRSLCSIYSFRNRSPLGVLVAGTTRLRTLSRFDDFRWRSVSHSAVGGVTNGKFWLGSNYVLRDDSLPLPKYCASAASDIMEFAPKSIFGTPCSAPTDALLSRQSSVLPCHSFKDTVWSSGLLPFKPLSSCLVATTTPFTPSGWNTRSLSTKEFARAFDAPVALEKRLHKQHPSSLPNDHPIFTSAPGKIIQHSLWLLSLTQVIGGGDNSFHELIHPIFELDEGDALVRHHEHFDTHNETLEEAHVKAVKHDDAEIPVYMWNDRLVSTHPNPTHINSLPRDKVDHAINVLRKFALRCWKRRVLQSLQRYLSSKYTSTYAIAVAGQVTNKHAKLQNNTEFYKDLVGGLDCLDYSAQCSWWEWTGGSRLFFWRWSDEFRNFARDGVPVYWGKEGKPTEKKKQPPVPDPVVKAAMRKKVQKVRNRRYVAPGFVKSLIYFFAVPKGPHDIRMVYDGTASGFNNRIWVPNFGLPTCDTLLRGTEPGSWMVDLDIGDMFLNFMLDELVREYIGIDLSTLFEEELIDQHYSLWERWNRCAMGLKCSPYNAIKTMLFAMEFMKGYPSDATNPFEFDDVILNLPGMEHYDPSEKWFRVIRKNKLLASILAMYVDDERIHGDSKDNVWNAAHQIASRETYLGIQDAARKRRPPTRTAGAWAGSVIRTNDKEVGVVVSDERWTKTKKIVNDLYIKLQGKTDDQKLNTKSLLSDRGFLIYVARTYKTITPFLKGIHLSIDGWRDNRDEDGWKIATRHMKDKGGSGKSQNSLDVYKYPDTVTPVKRLINDVKALKELTKMDKPPVVIKQSNKIFVVKYGFGDASGGGFGSTIQDKSGLKIMSGTWNESGSKKSSNFRELSNFVIRLEAEAAIGSLFGSEMFFFTDNDTAQNAYHNGTSSSKLLFELVVRLKKLELQHGLRLHLIHVAGTRMIEQGTDGISRGNLMEGVMTGQKMLSFVPIHQTVIERFPQMLEWIRSWAGKADLLPLKPRDWLWKGQGLGRRKWKNCDGFSFPVASKEGIYLWTPPPAVADVALEFLRESIHRRPTAIHIFVVPKLMPYLWRKSLLKTCDFSFYIDAGHNFWPSEMHESCLFAIYLPLLHCFPWSLRNSGSVLEVARLLSSLPSSEGRTKSIILRKFLLFQRRLSSMPEGMVRSLLQKKRIR